MRHTILWVAVFWGLTAALWAQNPPPAGLVIKVVTDRPEALYRCGETAHFAFSASLDGQPVTAGKFVWTLTLDGVKPLSQGEGEWGTEPAQVSGSLIEPGILRCTVIVREGQPRPVVALGGAAFEPEKIQPTVKEPEDFVKFWEDNKAAVRAIPADIKLEKSDQHSTPTVNVYKLSLANLNGTRVYAWLGVPVKEGKYPAVLTVPAAGYNPPGPGGVTWANRGFIAATMYAHDYPLDLPAEKYDELKAGPLANYMHQGKESRETYYFRRVFMGCTRLMDYLMARPEWDGQNLIVTGSSQGGALSLVSAGLEPKVTAIAANVPALCDHTGRAAGRQPGWPNLIPADKPEVAFVAAYYDAVNFARHARCKTLMGVGYIDTTCPPMGVYSAFNVLPEPKKMMAFPRMGHSVDSTYSQAAMAFITALGQLKTDDN